jgi:glutamate 5-kinase
MARFPSPSLVVVKVGSSSLRDADGRLDLAQVANLAGQVARLHADGARVVVVSSGAVAAGMGQLGLARRPTDTPTLQAAAAVGQGALVHAYRQVLSEHGVVGAQLLLSQDDFVIRRRYLNARTSLQRLLELGAVPIINENDAIATEELTYGDNDHLAALVCSMLGADLLVMLSDVEGMLDRPPSDPEARLIDRIDDPDRVDLARIGGTGSNVGSGGMRTKIGAAQVAVRTGSDVVIADARRPDVVVDAAAGAEVGTWFVAQPGRMDARRLWIAFALSVRGRIHVDEGAVRVLTGGSASLLGVGVTGCDGTFHAGDAVEVVGADGTVIARGLAAYEAADVARIAGRSTESAVAAFGSAFGREVIHRDDLVVTGARRAAAEGDAGA